MGRVSCVRGVMVRGAGGDGREDGGRNERGGLMGGSEMAFAGLMVGDSEELF